VRYARHIAGGLGWRFNAGGPTTDGVTPLPWPLVLAIFARGDALTVLFRAKVLGLATWTGTAIVLGWAIGRVDVARLVRVAALAVLALSVPVAAYAVSGMETPIATALATAAALNSRRPVRCAAIGGVAAVFRPELGAWAIVLAVAAAFVERRGRPWIPLVAAIVAAAPSIACGLVRAAVWGRPVPLAVLAKPGRIDQGFAYAVVACIVALVPLIVLSPKALLRSKEAGAIFVAFVAHFVAMSAVGGDWMPYARLVVPVVPAMAYASVLVAVHERLRWWSLRALTVIGGGAAMLWLGRVQLASPVGSDRAALIARARPWLAPIHSIAALDIGWVGASCDAEIIDLAGVTDPSIASLPGGHTSKRVGAMLLVSRGVDALLLYAPRGLPGGDLNRWADASYPRAVEARLAWDSAVARRYLPQAWLPLGSAGAGYVLLRARPGDDS
jgi:hypothetical protein